MFKLFNREEMFLHDIAPLSAINREVLNGEDTLDLVIDGDILIDKKYRILIYIKKYATWKEYIVEEVIEDRLEGTKSIYAENSIYELLGDFIEDKRTINTTANIALAKALEPTRWEIGRVDDLGIATATFYRTNAKQALNDISIAWKCDIQIRIVIDGNKIIHRYVDLLTQRGNYLGERFVTGENINKITRAISADSVCTALYGFGKGEEIEGEDGEATGGFGRRIDFSDLNNGKMFVEDEVAKQKWGRLNLDGTKSHIFGKLEFDDIEDRQLLLETTTNELERLKEPNIVYEGELIGSVAQLGDTVIIVDDINIPNLRLTARVYELENDLLDDNKSKPVLGNYKKDIADSWAEQQEYINGFRGKQGIWDRADSFDKEGNLNTQYLNGVIDVLQNKLLSTVSGWYTDDNGNIVLDAKDGSSSMMLSGAGFMIANTKLANGNWEYRTFGTGEGFTADEIIAGVLRGGKVNFDLTNGTLLIGNNIDDYTLLFDGNNLHINIDGKDLGEKLQGFATKDEFNNLNINGRNLVSNLPDNWEDGGINIYTGNNTTSSGYKRTRDFYYRQNGTLIVTHEETYIPYIFIYDDNKQFLSSHEVLNKELILEDLLGSGYFRVEISRPSFNHTQLGLKSHIQLAESSHESLSGSLSLDDLFLKVENSNNKTGFTESPEDVFQQKDKIRTSLEIMSDKIVTKVEEGNIISSINQSAEVIKVSANKINLVGSVEVLSEITGDLGVVTAGTINGVTINSVNSNGNKIILDNGKINVLNGTDLMIDISNYSTKYYDFTKTGKLAGSINSTTRLPKCGLAINTLPNQFITLGRLNVADGDSDTILEIDTETMETNVWQNGLNLNTRDIKNVRKVWTNRIQFNHDRPWEFLEYGSGASSGLGLRPTVGLKIFTITNDTNYPMCEFIAASGSAPSTTKVSGHLLVTGNKNSLVSTKNYGQRLLYAEESTKAYFTNKFKTKLNSGVHVLMLNKMFLETISSYFVLPIVRSRGNVYILEELEDRFKVEVESDGEVDIVFVVNGIRKGYENIFMEEYEEIETEKRKTMSIGETTRTRNVKINGPEMVKPSLKIVNEEGVIDYGNDNN